MALAVFACNLARESDDVCLEVYIACSRRPRRSVDARRSLESHIVRVYRSVMGVCVQGILVSAVLLSLDFVDV